MDVLLLALLRFGGIRLLHASLEAVVVVSTAYGRQLGLIDLPTASIFAMMVLGPGLLALRVFRTQG